MGRPSIEFIIDMDNRDVKRQLLATLGAFSGLYEVSIKPKRDTRTLRQNSFYHGFIVKALHDYLNQQQYGIDHEAAHGLLKDEFLRVPVMNPRTGRVVRYRTRSTTELSVEEMSKYIEDCRLWLEDKLGIVLPMPDEQPANNRNSKRQALTEPAEARA